MKLLLKNIKELVEKDLTVVQRGLLITILLLREDDSKLTLAKFKAKVKISDYKQDLIYLQDNNLIKWSGYTSAKKSIEADRHNPSVIRVISFMNELYGRDFDCKSKSTCSNLIKRLEEHSEEDVLLVVANRWKEWKDDILMSKYLQPTTIFRPSKFDKYLEEAKRTHKGESLLEAKKIGLNNGDEITFEISKSLIDSELYAIDIKTLTKGEYLSGRREVKSGKDIKNSLKGLENEIKYGGVREFKFYYRNRE